MTYSQNQIIAMLAHGDMSNHERYGETLSELTPTELIEHIHWSSVLWTIRHFARAAFKA